MKFASRKSKCMPFAAWPSRLQNHCGHRRKNRSKIDAGEVPGAPKIKSNSMPGGSQDAPWRSRASRRRLGSISGASREHLGACPASPESVLRVPKGGSVRQRGRPGAPGSAPKQPKSTLSRVRKRKKRVFSTRRVREALSKRFVAVFHRFSVFPQRLRPL